MDSADLEVLRGAVAWLDDGQAVHLLTVVETFGSAPRPVGSMLAVAADGRFTGSVSGGCVESDLARELAATPLARPRVRQVGISDAQAARVHLPCGGHMRLVCEPVADAASLRPAVDALARRQRVERRLDLATGAACLVDAPDGAEALVFDGERLVRVFGPGWRLILIGAGQVSRFVAEMALALDYEVLVCEPREGYADAWRVEGAPLVREHPDTALQRLAPDPRTAVLALAHDPNLEDLGLAEALRRPTGYVGALGSRGNAERRRHRLVTLLDVTPQQAARLHGPVGLPIGSRTPGEIAISALAQLTAVRRGAGPGAAAATDPTVREAG